jgi:hypothetical protein
MLYSPTANTNDQQKNLIMSYTKPVIVVRFPGLRLPRNSLLHFIFGSITREQPLVHSPLTPANHCRCKACIDIIIFLSYFQSTHSAFRAREALMSRANSLKKAIRQIIEHTERAVDEQNAQSILPTIHSPCPGTPCPGTPMMNSPMNEKREFPEAGTSSSGSKFLEVPQFSVFTSPVNSRPSSRTASPRLSPRLKRLGKEKGEKPWSLIFGRCGGFERLVMKKSK